ncbi:MAG: hypothetical protein NXI01_00965 [Gammaproteobacteria bacterium]|nr:hypothetical protein [Gammaproteobacteria bacterium]
MATSTRQKHNGATHHRQTSTKHIHAAASDFLDDGRKLAHALYQDGSHHMNLAEKNVKEYSDKALKQVQKNPVATVLIAGGIGFLLSALFRK